MQSIPLTAPKPLGQGYQAARIITTVLGMVWLGVFPLLGVIWRDGWPIQVPLSYSVMTRSKWELCLLLSMLGAALTPVILICARKRINWKHPARWLLLGYFAWVALSAWQGSGAQLTNAAGERIVWIGSGRYEGLATQLCYAAILLSMSLVKPHIKPVLAAAAVGAMLMTAVTAMQYAGQNPLGFYPGGRSIYTNYEFQGTLGNIDMVAGYLALVTPLLLGSWVLQGGWMGVLTLPAGALCVLLMLMIDVQSGLLALLAGVALLVVLMLLRPEMRSRGCMVLALVLACFTLRKLIGLPWVDGLEAPWLCEVRPDALLPKLTGTEPVVFPWNVTLKKLLPLLAAVVLLGLAAWFRKREGRGVMLRFILIGCAVLAAAAAACVWLLPIPQSMGGLWELHEILNGRMQDSFGSERYGIWRHTLMIAREHLLFGTGPDTFLPVMRQHLSQVGAAFVQTFDNPHNILLAILVQNGVPALLLFMAGGLAAMLWERKHAACLAVAAGLACYAAQCMFCFSLCIVTPVFWAMTGMCIALCDHVTKG